MVFGMVYWLAPRLFQTPIARPGWVNLHFWMATVGILLYVVFIYAAGITQGLMWRAFNADGILQYDFLSSVTTLIPLYWVRSVGGGLYLGGLLLGCLNLFMTWQRRPKVYDEPVYEAPALSAGWKPDPIPASTIPAGSTLAVAHTLNRWGSLRWHRNWEAMPLTFTVWTTIAVVVASLFEIVPMFSIRSDIPRIASVTPYTPLELVGRDIYISEGCVNCHSQMIRPLVAETERYGEYSKPGESVYDHPFLWGSRRIGPDLAREGVRNPSALWHLRHFNNPLDTSPGSIMPAYPHLLEKPLDYGQATRAVAAMRRLGIDYGEMGPDEAADQARAQSERVMAGLIQENGTAEGVELFRDTQVMAVIAYMQRLGVDIGKPAEAPPAANASMPPARMHAEGGSQ